MCVIHSQLTFVYRTIMYCHQLHVALSCEPKIMRVVSNDFILAFTGQCLLLCVALERDDETPNYWSTSIGSTFLGPTYVYANHWTTELSYVCQYHSKLLRGD